MIRRTLTQIDDFLSSSRIFGFIFAILMALFLWVIAMEIRNRDVIPVWYDQKQIFMESGRQWLTPYDIPGFVNPPWLTVFMIPLSRLPIELAILIQLQLYFVTITAIVYRLGGGWQAIVIALTSFVALDASLELGIDWIVMIGLLLPASMSAPFVFVKPQTALGYYTGTLIRQWVWLIAGAIVTGIVSVIIWGWWLPDALRSIQQYTVTASVNLAPMQFITPFMSMPIGLLLLWQAYRKGDPSFGVFGWLFVVPYIALYSLLLPLALFAIRFPRIALLISVVMWIIYGRFIILIFSA